MGFWAVACWSWGLGAGGHGYPCGEGCGERRSCDEGCGEGRASKRLGI